MKLNAFLHGDCLGVLKNFPDACVDLIYLDPPFCTGKIWIGGAGIFSDRWDEGLKSYLEFMRERLKEMKRVLKDAGSIYLHCDQTASHYLKLEMDKIFGKENFRNEIIWHYSAGHSPKMDFKRKHDVIFRYSKTNDCTFNQPTMDTLEPDRFNLTDDSGRKYRINHTRDKNGNYKRFYMDAGTPCDDVWTYVRDRELNSIGSTAKERVDYPTQKPIALLERIINASSNKGDVVLDPMCGSGTTLIAAENLGRKWIGIDLNDVESIIKKRSVIFS